MSDTQAKATPPIEGLLLHIRKQFGEKGDTDALILRWADLAADEYLRLSDSRTQLLEALKAIRDNGMDAQMCQITAKNALEPLESGA